MKKLLVLSLVLGIASLATAGLSLSASGNVATVSLNPTENINFYLTVEKDAGAYTIALLDNAGGLSELGTVADYGDGWDTYFTTLASSTSDAAVAGAQITITYTGTGDADVALFEGSSPYGQIGSTVNIVPEPATMALLGLGALVLRRKK